MNVHCMFGVRCEEACIARRCALRDGGVHGWQCVAVVDIIVAGVVLLLGVLLFGHIQLVLFLILLLLLLLALEPVVYLDGGCC